MGGWHAVNHEGADARVWVAAAGHESRVVLLGLAHLIRARVTCGWSANLCRVVRTQLAEALQSDLPRSPDPMGAVSVWHGGANWCEELVARGIGPYGESTSAV